MSEGDHHHMQRPQFENKFSTGNVIQIVILVISVAGGVAGGWAIIDSRTTTNEGGIQTNAEDIQTSYENYVRLEARVRSLETYQARSSERQENMLDLLSRIDDRLERMEERTMK